MSVDFKAALHCADEFLTAGHYRKLKVRLCRGDGEYGGTRKRCCGMIPARQELHAHIGPPEICTRAIGGWVDIPKFGSIRSVRVDRITNKVVIFLDQLSHVAKAFQIADTFGRRYEAAIRQQ